jgi:hypothetical protein
MGFWTDVVISVPKVTFRKLKDLVEELYYFESGEELDGRCRKELAEKLAVRVIEQYVAEYFSACTRAAAEMFRSRSKGGTMLSP